MSQPTLTDVSPFKRLPIAVGDTFAERYRIVRELGAGGMGAVFEAEHVFLKHRVALKVMIEAARLDDDTVIARFFNEGVCGVRVTHPNVARVYDAAILESTGIPYIIMELLEGQNLRAFVPEDVVAHMDAVRALTIMEQVSAALVAIHAKGIVHRDLKPENIFLVEGLDHQEQVKVLDFGVSKFIDANPHGSQLTASNVIMGTPRYIAPEQLLDAKRADARADVWSCGVILYELLAGERPFDADNITALAQLVLSRSFVPLSDLRPELPESVFAVVEKCIELKPQNRFASAIELHEAILIALEDVRAGVAASAALPGARAQKGRPARIGEAASWLSDDTHPESTPSALRPTADELPASASAQPRQHGSPWWGVIAVAPVLAVLLLGGGYWMGMRRGDANDSLPPPSSPSAVLTAIPPPPTAGPTLPPASVGAPPPATPAATPAGVVAVSAASIASEPAAPTAAVAVAVAPVAKPRSPTAAALAASAADTEDPSTSAPKASATAPAATGSTPLPEKNPVPDPPTKTVDEP